MKNELRNSASIRPRTLPFILIPKLRLGIPAPEAPLQKGGWLASPIRTAPIKEAELLSIPSQAELGKEVIGW